MRGDQLSRKWRILRQLEVSKNGLTAAEIAEMGGISLRTAYRDLDDLQLAGFPLYPEKREGCQCWKFVDTYKSNLPFPFTCTELMSLHMSRDLFKIFKGTVFFDSLESFLTRCLPIFPLKPSLILERYSPLSTWAFGHTKITSAIGNSLPRSTRRLWTTVVSKSPISRLKTLRHLCGKWNPTKFGFMRAPSILSGYVICETKSGHLYSTGSKCLKSRRKISRYPNASIFKNTYAMALRLCLTNFTLFEF